MKLLILLIMVIEYLFDEYLTYRIWKQRSKPLPDEVKDIYDHDRYLEFIEYKKAYKKVIGINKIISLIISLVVLFSPLFKLIDSLSNNVYLIVLYSILIIDTISIIISIIYDYYCTFKIEEKFGKNHKTLKIFIKDELLENVFGYLVNIFLQMLFVMVIEYLIRIDHINLEKAILIVGIVALVFTIIILIIMGISVLVMKTQYQFVDLEPSALLDSINDLQSDAKKKVKHITVYNESSKSNSKNAFLLKLLWYKEFSIADNFLKENATREVLAVFAHEIGHLKHKKDIYDYAKYLLLVLVVLLAVYLVSNISIIRIFIERVNDVYGLNTNNYYLIMMIIGIYLKPAIFIIETASNYISRRNEYEADYNAIKNGYGKELIKTFKDLSSDELVDVYPDQLVEFLKYNHPGMYNRIKFILKKDEELNEKNNIS